MKITIVEDTPLYIGLLKKALSEHEVSIVWTFSGNLNECISEIRSKSPDIILLDHDLGAEFTGEDIAKHFPRCRIISISSVQSNYCNQQFAEKAGLPRSSKKLIELIGMTT